MWLVGGDWNVAAENEEKLFASLWKQVKGMAIDGVKYVNRAPWGSLVLLKACGGIVYGASDVLNVSFSEPNGINDKNSPGRLGFLFACMGLGCTVGPLIADRLTNMKNPASLQKACIVALGCAALGMFGMGSFDPFWSICIFTLVRSAGAAINWIDSSLLLQKFSSDQMMGRVLATDFSLALLAEASSAYMAGFLEDRMHLTANHTAFVMAGIGATLTLSWLIYHLCGLGAVKASNSPGSEQKHIAPETNPLVNDDIETNGTKN
jgi:MFS family permease